MFEKLVFKKGLSTELPVSAKENVLLFTEDTGRIYKGAGDGKPLISYSDVLRFDTLDLLQANPGVFGKLYIVGASVYVFDGTVYQEVGGSGSVIGHDHANKDVIDKFSVDATGKLLFDGKPIASEPSAQKGVITPQALEYGSYTLSANLNDIGSTTTIVFDISVGNLKMTNGQVLLKAGKAYSVSINMHSTLAASGLAYYHLFDHTNNKIINPRASSATPDYTGTFAANGGIEFIITPETDILVSLRAQTAIKTVSYAYSAFVIKELPQSVQRVVADIDVTGDKMTITYSDSTTKEITIQGGAGISSFVSKSFGATEW